MTCRSSALEFIGTGHVIFESRALEWWPGPLSRTSSAKLFVPDPRLIDTDVPFVNLPFVRISFFSSRIVSVRFRRIWVYSQLYNAFDTEISRLTPMLAPAYSEWMNLWAWNYFTFPASPKIPTGILSFRFLRWLASPGHPTFDLYRASFSRGSQLVRYGYLFHTSPNE